MVSFPSWVEIKYNHCRLVKFEQTLNPSALLWLFLTFEASLRRRACGYLIKELVRWWWSVVGMGGGGGATSHILIVIRFKCENKLIELNKHYS